MLSFQITAHNKSMIDLPVAIYGRVFRRLIMKASTSRFAEMPLEKLIDHALHQLLRLRYSRNALKRYRTVWQRFTAYCREEGKVGGYSEEMATRFIKKYQAARSERLTAQTSWRRHVNFDVLVLRAFALDGRVDRPVVYNSQLHVQQAMRKPLADFEQFCRERLHLRAACSRRGGARPRRSTARSRERSP